MVPAWHETGVIGKMAELAATTLDYENYHIFVGTYPNDPDTQRDVDAGVRALQERPQGGLRASRTDQQGRLPEQRARRDPAVRAAGRPAVRRLHPARRRRRHLRDGAAPLQLSGRSEGSDSAAGLSVRAPMVDFTSAHYMDEFAELHGKDILVREALAGQVPSAGRRYVLQPARGDGAARRRRRHRVRRAEPDRGLRHRLQAQGQGHVGNLRAVPGGQGRATAPAAGPAAFGTSAREASVICVREYFPSSVAAAIRQKSRWIIGIVYQGFKTHRGRATLVLNYFLWRDRKGGVINFVSFLATLVLLQLTAAVGVPDRRPGQLRVPVDLRGRSRGSRCCWPPTSC